MLAQHHCKLYFEEQQLSFSQEPAEQKAQTSPGTGAWWLRADGENVDRAVMPPRVALPVTPAVYFYLLGVEMYGFHSLPEVRMGVFLFSISVHPETRRL